VPVNQQSATRSEPREALPGYHMTKSPPILARRMRSRMRGFSRSAKLLLKKQGLRCVLKQWGQRTQPMATTRRVARPWRNHCLVWAPNTASAPYVLVRAHVRLMCPPDVSLKIPREATPCAASATPCTCIRGRGGWECWFGMR